MLTNYGSIKKFPFCYFMNLHNRADLSILYIMRKKFCPILNDLI